MWRFNDPYDDLEIKIFEFKNTGRGIIKIVIRETKFISQIYRRQVEQFILQKACGKYFCMRGI